MTNFAIRARAATQARRKNGEHALSLARAEAAQKPAIPRREIVRAIAADLAAAKPETPEGIRFFFKMVASEIKIGSDGSVFIDCNLRQSTRASPRPGGHGRFLDT